MALKSKLCNRLVPGLLLFRSATTDFLEPNPMPNLYEFDVFAKHGGGGEEEGRKERRKAKEETSRDKGKPA